MTTDKKDIERVARAIAAEVYNDTKDVPIPRLRQDYVDTCWSAHTNRAKAAIEAYDSPYKAKLERAREVIEELKKEVKSLRQKSDRLVYENRKMKRRIQKARDWGCSYDETK